MRIILLFLLPFLLLPHGLPAYQEESPPYPQPNSDVPGPFSPYNATGFRKGKFHCLVTHHALNPVAMVVIRGTELTDPMKYLLGKLNTAVEKNPNTRLASFAVFLTDEIKEIAAKTNEDDDKRDELEKKLEDIARDGNLKHVVLTLATKNMLDKYKIPDTAEIVVLLYNRYRVVSYHALTREQLTEAKAKEILGEVAEKLGARR